MTEPSGATLLVLGASSHQLPVIEAARRRGLRAAVVDDVSSNPGHQSADASHVVSTTDVDAVERVARAESADGIVAACTDVAVPTAAIVAERLGLCGVPPASASLVTSKAGFRRWQLERGMPAPASVNVIADNGRARLGRLIVKPDRSSGSKATRIVAGDAEIAAAVAAAAELSEQVVAERVIEGQHISVEALLKDGNIVWSVVLDRQTAPLPWVATVGHRLPTTLAPVQQDAAIAAVQEVASELSFFDGPLDADLVVAHEPVILELSPRLGGNSIGPLLELAAGVDLVDAAIDAALGLEVDDPGPAPPAPSAVVLLGTDAAGELNYDRETVEELRAETWVALLELEPPGTAVRAFVDGRAVIGRALITGEDRAAIDARCCELLDRVGAEAR